MALILSLPPLSVSLGNNVVIDVFMIGNNYTDNIMEPSATQIIFNFDTII